MDLSFVILTWNSEKHIIECLDSIRSTLLGHACTYEIFVVDNFSTDKTRQLLDKYKSEAADGLYTEYLSKNCGTTVSRNLALRKVSGDYVVVLDSDVTLQTDTIRNMIDTLQRDAEIGLVAPKLIYPDGRVQKSTDQFPTILSKFSRFFFLKNMEKNLQVAAEPIDVDYAISAVWMFRKSLLDKVGFLDENIFYAPEDADYCLGCWQAGLRVVYTPDAVAVHDAQEISRGFFINRSKLQHFLGLLYFFKKRHFWFSPPAFSKNKGKKTGKSE